LVTSAKKRKDPLLANGKGDLFLREREKKIDDLLSERKKKEKPL